MLLAITQHVENLILRRRVLKLHPATLILLSFVCAIAIGALLLKLPVATQTGSISWIDALFTATSAVCVTGLIVVDTGSYFSTFGQGVILCLIQIGGLGVMTVSVLLFQWFGRNLSFRQRKAMQDLFSHTPREDIIALVKNILLLTLVVEGCGAVLLTLHWRREFPFLSSVYKAVFHSVSAFCNAGFSLFPGSMATYSGSLLPNTTLCGLIIVGGLGFPVLYDLQCRFQFRRGRRCKLSIQTKTVLLTTAILIFAGAVMFAGLEHSSQVGMPKVQQILISLFQSVTSRTAGFNTVDIAGLKEATLLMIIFLMFFGASPGSCGGGVKTTTLALLAAFALSRIRRRRRVNLFKKSVPAETVTRSVSLVLISIGIIGIVLFLILAADAATRDPGAAAAHFGFLPYLFETVSAFGTVGLSMGITPYLNAWAKCWIILTMIIGRVGVLTFSYIIAGTVNTNGIEHSEENLMIG